MKDKKNTDATERPLDKPVGLCGKVTIMRSGDDDSGKFRTCERVKGHDGKHMTTYCGKRRFWAPNELDQACGAGPNS